MRGGAGFVLWAGVLLPACGAIDDISAMRGEVAKTNANMETLIGISRETGGSLSGLETKLGESVRAVQKSVEIMTDLSRDSDVTVAELRKSVAVVEASLARLEEGLSYTRQLVQQGKVNVSTISRVLDEVAKTAEYTRRLLGKTEQQETVILSGKLEEFTRNVWDYGLPNHFRVASAIAAYRILLDSQAPPDWHGIWVAAKLEMCNTTPADPDGRVCPQLFKGKLGTVLKEPENPPPQLTAVLDGSPEILKYIRLPQFRPNFVYALGLAPQFVRSFFDAVAADRTNPQARKAKNFLTVASRMLVEFMTNTVRREKPAAPLDTADLTAVAERMETVGAITGLPGLGDEKISRQTRLLAERLTAAIGRRRASLSDEDGKLLERIRAAAGLPV